MLIVNLHKVHRSMFVYVGLCWYTYLNVSVTNFADFVEIATHLIDGFSSRTPYDRVCGAIAQPIVGSLLYSLTICRVWGLTFHRVIDVTKWCRPEWWGYPAHFLRRALVLSWGISSVIPTKPTVNISKWFLYRKIYDPMTKCLDDPQLQIGTWIGG